MVLIKFSFLWLVSFKEIKKKEVCLIVLFDWIDTFLIKSKIRDVINKVK